MKEITLCLTFCFLVIANLQSQSNLIEPNQIIELAKSQLKSEESFIGAFGEIVFTLEDEKKTTVFPYYKKPKPLSRQFTGYSIQLTTSMEQLEKSHAVFNSFGEIIIEEAANPRYCYLVGEFKTLSAAQKHLLKVIKPQFSEAKLIYFDEGRRMNFL